MNRTLWIAAVITLAGCPANNKVVNNQAASCKLDGDVVYDGDPCTCDDGADGTISCAAPPSCSCDVADMAVANDQGSDTGGGSDASMPDSGPTDTGGTDAGPDVGTDAGVARHRGTCMTSPDCNNPDWECITIPANDPNGYHTCQPSTAAEPGCATIEDPDTCCLHSDCNQADPSGTCITGPIFYCGGVAPIIANVCVTDECATDADCDADSLCLPPRVLGEPVARCVPTQCMFDADCTGGTGGQCNPFFDPCNGRFTGFGCTYDDSECRSNDDCTDSNLRFCQRGTGDGDTACVAFFPPP